LGRSEYEVSAGYVRLIAPRSPAPDAAARIVLTKRLVTVDTAIIVAVIGALATVLAAWLQYSRGFTAATMEVSKDEAMAEGESRRVASGQAVRLSIEDSPLVVDANTGAGEAPAARDGASNGGSANKPSDAASGGGKHK
jgi:hypothetical protein